MGSPRLRAPVRIAVMHEVSGAPGPRSHDAENMCKCNFSVYLFGVRRPGLRRRVTAARTR